MMGRERGGVYRCRRVGKNTKRRKRDVYQENNGSLEAIGFVFVFSVAFGEPIFFSKITWRRLIEV